MKILPVWSSGLTTMAAVAESLQVTKLLFTLVTSDTNAGKYYLRYGASLTSDLFAGTIDTATVFPFAIDFDTAELRTRFGWAQNILARDLAPLPKISYARPVFMPDRRESTFRDCYL